MVLLVSGVPPVFVLNRTLPEQGRPLIGDRDEVPEQVHNLRGIPIRLWNESQSQT